MKPSPAAESNNSRQSTVDSRQTHEEQHDVEVMMEKMLRDLCSASEAAAILGVDERHVRALAKSGRIAARKVDTIWIVYKPSLNKYLQSKSKRGRPPGPKS